MKSKAPTGDHASPINNNEQLSQQLDCGSPNTSTDRDQLTGQVDDSTDSNPSPDNGRKLVFDNLDYIQKVHYMTEEHQNIDKHAVTVMATENRVSGNHLSDEERPGGILEMNNGFCIPNYHESILQRENYIALVGRIITKNLPKLEFLANTATQHIPHQYKKEMSAKSDTVSTYLKKILNII